MSMRAVALKEGFVPAASAVSPGSAFCEELLVLCGGELVDGEGLRHFFAERIIKTTLTMSRTIATAAKLCMSQGSVIAV